MKSFVKFIQTKCSPLLNFLSKLIGSINWKQSHGITSGDILTLKELLTTDYYLITTRHSNHLSTYMISFSDKIITGKWSFYGHALMNLEDSIQPGLQFELCEAIGTGVHWGNFEDIFGDADAVCLLKPRNMNIDYWTKIFEQSVKDIGKPYDTVFNINQDDQLSCIELVRNALMAEPNYKSDFANFEAMITKYDNLTPQMLRDCEDFEVVFEVKR